MNFWDKNLGNSLLLLSEIIVSVSMFRILLIISFFLTELVDTHSIFTWNIVWFELNTVIYWVISKTIEFIDGLLPWTFSIFYISSLHQHSVLRVFLCFWSHQRHILRNVDWSQLNIQLFLCKDIRMTFEGKMRQFFKTHSRMFIGFKSFLQKLFWYWTDIKLENKVIYFFILYFSYQLFLIFSLPRSLSHQHLEKDNSKSPNISFESVFISSQWLWSHIKRRANIVFVRFESIRCFYGKSKISNFKLLFWRDKNICRFKISVNHIFFGKINVSY